MRFPLEILDDRLLHQRIAGSIDHFFYRHQLDYVWKMQVPCPVDSTHAPNTNYLLDHVPLNQDGPINKLAGLAFTRAEILSNILRIHGNWLNYIRHTSVKQLELPYGFIRP